MITIDTIKKAVSPICKKYGVRRASLFGSYARQEATENSDVDIYIEPGEIHSLFTLSAFRIELVEVLGLSVDIVSECPNMTEFKMNIKKDEVLLYED